MKKTLIIQFAAALLAVCTVHAQRPILEVDVVATDAEDGFVGLSEIATGNLALYTVARVKGQTTPGDGGGGSYFWDGSEWSAFTPEADDGPVAGVGRLNLPATRRRLLDMDSGTFNGAQRNHFTSIAFGDSMARRGAYPWIVDQLEATYGRAGVGLDGLWYQVTSGTVNEGVTDAPREQDLWPSGGMMEITSGAVMVIGEQVGQVNTPVNCDTVSFYFAEEVGGGSVSIESSNDNGASWSVLAASVSTNAAPGTDPVKTYSLTEDNYLFRVTGLSGTVEFIGALARNDGLRGVVCLLSQVGGVDFDTGLTTANQAILSAVLADIAPELVVTHGSQSDAADAAAVADWVDMIVTAAPLADQVLFNDHEQEADDTRVTLHNPVYAAKAETTRQLEVFDVSAFLNWELSDALGWNDGDSDPVHQDPAWPFIASIFCQNLGIEGNASALGWFRQDQAGSLNLYQNQLTYPTKTEVLEMLGSGGSSHNLRWTWLDGADKEYWQMERLPSTNGAAPLGFRLTRVVNGGDEVLTFDASSRAYFGSESGGITSRFDARVRVHEGSGAAATIGASHSSVSGMVWEGWNHNGNSPLLTSTITAGGTAMFQTLDVTNWPTYADEAAADAAGIPVGSAYKTPTGELRFRVD